MCVKNYMLPLWAAAALAVAPSFGQAALPDLNVPGIAPAGYANFSDAASITLTKQGSMDGTGGYLLTATSTGATGPFVFQYDPSTSFNVNGTFNLSATFNSTGTFIGGNVGITGTIPGYNGPGNAGTVATASQNLFSANLSAFNVDIASPSSNDALGFTTDKASFSGWASQFAANSNESVYLYAFGAHGLMSLFTNPRFTPGSSITLQGQAVTTVPIPAAVWLFGSSLAFLTGVGARRKKAAPAS